MDAIGWAILIGAIFFWWLWGVIAADGDETWL